MKKKLYAVIWRSIWRRMLKRFLRKSNFSQRFLFSSWLWRRRIHRYRNYVSFKGEGIENWNSDILTIPLSLGGFRRFGLALWTHYVVQLSSFQARLSISPVFFLVSTIICKGPKAVEDKKNATLLYITGSQQIHHAWPWCGLLQRPWISTIQDGESVFVFGPWFLAASVCNSRPRRRETFITGL